VSAANSPESNAGPVDGFVARFRHLMELIRFSHTVFALPFAMLSAAIAWTLPDTVFRWQDLLGILLCMVFARSAAMAFNRIVDAQIDAGNPRTAGRHIPAGILSRKLVIVFTLGCSAAFVASTLIFLPKQLPIVLAVPVLLFLLSYSYAKRLTSLCHYWLSTALMLSPISAWIAVRDEFALIPVLLGAVIFFWVGGFDIIYACQDADFDRERKLFSIPARLGIRGALRLAFLSHLLTIACLFLLWHYSPLGTVFFVGVSLISLLLLYQHALVKPDDLTRVNIAFFNVNSVVSIGLLLLGLADLGIDALARR
jgi:4-hydroxybenzoate polyprenyltransferase